MRSSLAPGALPPPPALSLSPPIALLCPLPASHPPTLTSSHSHPSSLIPSQPHPLPHPTLTPHPIPPCGSHDSVITNPVLGWSAMMDYVSDWQTALGYGEEAAAAPAARG